MNGHKDTVEKMVAARRWLTTVIAISLLAAACGGSGVATDDEDGLGVLLQAEDLVECNGRPLTLSSLDTIEPLDERPEIVEAIIPFLDSGEGSTWPRDDLQVITVSETRAVAVALQTEVQIRERRERGGGTVEEGFGDGVDDGITLFMQGAEFRDGAWMWSGSSVGDDCLLETPPPVGLNRVEWEIDPDAPEPNAGSTTVQLLATEVECVSGEAMGDRFNVPAVVETDTQVLVTLTATQPPGDAFDCPGNPYETVVIELGAPLGDRELRDGSTNLGRLSDHVGHVFGIDAE